MIASCAVAHASAATGGTELLGAGGRVLVPLVVGLAVSEPVPEVEGDGAAVVTEAVVDPVVDGLLGDGALVHPATPQTMTTAATADLATANLAAANLAKAGVVARRSSIIN